MITAQGRNPHDKSLSTNPMPGFRVKGFGFTDSQRWKLAILLVRRKIAGTRGRSESPVSLLVENVYASTAAKV